MKKDLDIYTLTRQEHRIMGIIWDRGSVTVREVYDAMSQDKPKANTTVLTLMQILAKKGVLSKQRVGRRHLYQPNLSKSQATRNQVNDLLVSYFDGNPRILIETAKMIETVEEYKVYGSMQSQALPQNIEQELG